MKKITLKTFTKNHPQAAQRLAKYVREQGNELTDDRIAIRERADGVLRARLMGPAWGAVEYNGRAWTNEKKSQAS